MTTPETGEMQPEFSPELICIAEMQGSLKKRLTLHGTMDESSQLIKWSYTAHRRVLTYLLDRVDEAEKLNLKNLGN